MLVSPGLPTREQLQTWLGAEGSLHQARSHTRFSTAKWTRAVLRDHLVLARFGATVVGTPAQVSHASSAGESRGQE